MTEESIQTTTDNVFEPGDGWREVSGTAQQPDLVEYIDGLPVRLWIREAPTPALPSEPYTVVWATWSNESSDAIVLTADGWYFLAAPSMSADVSSITGFEVLSEPRAVTAKAVLEPLRTRIATHVKPGFELKPDGSEDPESAGYVAGLGTAVAFVEAELRALKANA